MLLPSTVPTNPLGWFFPWPWVVSLHAQVVSLYARADGYSAEYLRGTSINLQNFLPLQLSSLQGYVLLTLDILSSQSS